MRVVVFGHKGQVAAELARLTGPELEIVTPGGVETDLSGPAAFAAAIATTPFDAVINAAAWTAFERAETKEVVAHVVNAVAPGAMAIAYAKAAILFSQISTEHVFDGSGTRPRMPNDATYPLGAYGHTKLAGDRAVRTTGGAHATLHTSWAFSDYGANCVKTVLRLAETHGPVTVVEYQIGGPTWAGNAARTCLAPARKLSADPEKSGVDHLSGGQDVSWADFTREVLAKAGRAVTVEDIPTSAWPTPAARLANSQLDCGGLPQFGLTRPEWRKGLAIVLQELGVTS